jgi:hypothetical protein
LHGFVLADDALVENLVEAQWFFLLAFEEAGDGDALLPAMISWGKPSHALAKAAKVAPGSSVKKGVPSSPAGKSGVSQSNETRFRKLHPRQFPGRFLPCRLAICARFGPNSRCQMPMLISFSSSAVK